jgi:hypothetical protein
MDGIKRESKMTSSPISWMIDPCHFKVAYQINPWMRPDPWGTGSSAAIESAVGQMGTAA